MLFSFPFIAILSGLDRSKKTIHYIGKFWGKMILKIAGVKVERYGSAKKRKYIIVCNHQSQVDIFSLFSALDLQFRWVAKKELFRIPVFGICLKLAGYIDVDRNDPKQAVRRMEKAVKNLPDDVSLLFFPEGTRSSSGKLLPFKKGPFSLAIRNSLPILPIAICGGFNIMPKGKKIFKKGKVKIVIKDPIYTDGMSIRDKDKLLKVVEEEIKETLEKCENL